MSNLFDLTQSHIVIKRANITKLQKEYPELYNHFLEAFAVVTRRKDKPSNKYIIVNEDEPYAKEVLELVRKKEFELAKIYEFKSDYTFWYAAKDYESAVKKFTEEGYEITEELSEKEIDKNTHVMITDEDDYSRMDVWQMLEKDIKRGIRMPYMIATTCI